MALQKTPHGLPNGENVLPPLEGESSCLDKAGFICLLPIVQHAVSQTFFSTTLGFTLNLSVFSNLSG